MKSVKIRYCTVFGKLHTSEWTEYSYDLTDEEAELYEHAVANKTPLRDVPALQEALWGAYDEIEKAELRIGIETEDEYVMECQGLAPMDTEELNELVADRDPDALAFFGLVGLSDEELDEWDADELEEIPTIAEFHKDFEPYSPYDEGWILQVEFVDPNGN